jgi:hypothetical protein
MKTCPASAFLVLLSLGLTLDASEPKYSDARSDGLLGPIRAVSTREERAHMEWKQPNGPTVALFVTCQECEYDSQGNRLKSGEIIDGEWSGEVTRFVRDSDGKVTEKLAENGKGGVYRREIFGPYGITEQEGFENGRQISHSFWFYDGNGHESESRSYDGNGVMTAHGFRMTDASGGFQEEWEYGADGSFSVHFVETNDPKTDTFTFTNFREDGSIKLNFTTVGTKVVSYWQEPVDKDELGDTFFMDPVGKTQEAYKCHSGNSCDHIITYFTDETRHQVSRMEWQGADGALKMSSDYEYELDPYGNWTKRTVRVWSSELGERKLYETDYRTLTYWNK